MKGIRGKELKTQIQFVRECVSSLKDQSILKNQNVFREAVKQQGVEGYGTIEADFLFCFISHLKPKKIIQIGCGVSTSVMLRAGIMANYNPKIVCIEPYPSAYLKSLHKTNKIVLIPQFAQEIANEQLADLEAGDLLFIDSTHTVKVGSEVNKIILEVLPQLKKGVFVHFHDIYFPYDYQRNIFKTTFFWNESTLLHAFLINNSRFAIKVSQSMLHYSCKLFLNEMFPNYIAQKDNHGIPLSTEGHFPCSIFLEVIENE